MKTSSNQKKTPSRAKKNKGIQKAEEILETAARILVEEGYAEMSMRRIARKSGITIGNLQYYFPTKDELWKSLLHREFRQYDEAQSTWLSKNQETSPENPLIHAIDYLLANQKDPRSCSVYWELWALSTHNAEADRVMREVYARYISNIQELVAIANPKLTKLRAGRIATLIVSFIEGISLFRGGQRPAFPNMKDIETDIHRVVLAMVKEG